MKKLNYSDINKQQLVDLRSQFNYQTGYVKHSINLNLSNFEKYATDLLSLDHPIVFIIDDVLAESVDEFAKINNEVNDFIHVEGYIDIAEFPETDLLKVNTISAEDFLEKKEDYILLDVRHPTEITRIAPKENLLNVPLEKLAESLHHLDQDKEIYTLCGSGNRSTTAASYLIKKGFNSTVIAGGMKAIEKIRNN